MQDARWAANDLDSIDVVGGEMTEIEEAARRVNGYSVDQHLRITALPAAQEQRRHRPKRSGLNNRGSRNLTESVGHPGHSPLPQVVTQNHRNCLGERARRLWRFGCGDYHGLEARGVRFLRAGNERNETDTEKQQGASRRDLHMVLV